MMAWFSISNHCVLGGFIAAETHTGTKAPMHCHGDRPVPSKGGGEPTPCCKVLKAIAVAKISVGASQLDFVLKEYPTGELAAGTWRAHIHTLELDTGPPRALSFTESVLQRSILAHAPPLSLS